MWCLSDDKMYIIPSPCAHMDPDVFITLAKETTSSLAVLRNNRALSQMRTCLYLADMFTMFITTF